MKVAVIPPIGSLELVAHMDYHMCLAHLVLEEDPDYLSFYRSQIARGAFVIMDNGAAEKQALTISELAHAVELLGPTETVLPDVLRDGTATIQRATEALENAEFQAALAKGSTRLMAVPHGHNVTQWITCAVRLLAIPQVSTIGISKFEVDVLPEIATEGRAALAKLLRIYGPQRPYLIHYLGMHGSPVEVSLDPYAARGVDTCLPIEAARQGVYFSEDFGLLFRPANWEYDPKAPLPASRVPIARHNIKVLQQMANEERK